MSLITNSNALLADLDYDNLSTGQKAKIDALIVSHSELIEKYCNRIFLADDYVNEKASGENENVIFVKNPPLNSILSININASDTDCDGDLFSFDGPIGEIRFNQNIDGFLTDNWAGSFAKGWQNILISYNGGFAEVPQAIQMICADLIIASFDPTVDAGNIESEKLGQYTYKIAKRTFQTKLLDNQQYLNLYKIRK